MKRTAISLLLLLTAGTAFGQFPTQFKNVIVIVQENRTPDNLFHFLGPKCPIPAGATGLNACIPSPVTSACYNISPCGLSNQVTKSNPNGDPVPITLTSMPLAMKGGADPDHSHGGFVNMCDADPMTFACRNDGAYKTSASNASYSYVTNSPVTNTDGSHGHLLDPYLTFAEQYGWGNFMYQTNQGPSYPAHQFLFSGTSAQTSADDTNAIFISENFNSKIVGNVAGCLVPASGTNKVVSPSLSGSVNPPCVENPGDTKECPITNVIGANNVGIFCYSHKSMVDLLTPRKLSWKYYATSYGSIWDAPDSFQALCDPQMDGSGNLTCAGAAFQPNGNVDIAYHGGDIINDIDNCKLANVSWVTPDGLWSDHPNNDPDGPSWVAAIINTLGNRATCPTGTPDAGQDYWKNTAIIVTWDDWGGWSDHQPAPYASSLPCTSGASCQGDYQYGFRVPLVVVSAYTPAHYINNVPHDFGSILRFIEGVDGLGEGKLGFADARSASDLREFFTLTAPRTYQTVPAPIPASYFATYSKASQSPDND